MTFLKKEWSVLEKVEIGKENYFVHLRIHVYFLFSY
jgi:hypothetical protein